VAVFRLPRWAAPIRCRSVWVRVSGTDADLTQGAFQATGRSADLAIEGGGFFLVEKGGTKLLSRAGSFGWDATGTLTNGDGARVLGWTPTGAGPIQPTGAPGAIQIPIATLPPVVTQNVTVGGNLTSSLPVAQTLTTTATVFDSLGAAHDVAISFEHMTATAASSTWEMTATYVDPAGVTTPLAFPGVPTTLTFNGAGDLMAPFPVTTSAAVTLGGGDPQVVTFALGDAMHAFSQYDRASTVDAPTHDGSGGAELVDVTFTTDGAISGRYANGETRTLAILALANVTNPGGLTRVGDNLFAMSPASVRSRRASPAPANSDRCRRARSKDRTSTSPPSSRTWSSPSAVSSEQSCHHHLGRDAADLVNLKR
jgi:flagellar hook protein FlgE